MPKMKTLLTVVFAAAALMASALIATPAQAMTMEECLAAHSAGYCDAALGTASNGDTSNYSSNIVQCSGLRTTTALAC
jgi:hypothetical protein